MSNDEKKLAIVTGGNRGLGLEVSRQLAQKGYHVVLTARDPEQAKRAAHGLAGVGKVQAAQLDVSDAASVQAFAEQAQAELGRAAVLVNNAGIALKGFDAEIVKATLAV